MGAQTITHGFHCKLPSSSFTKTAEGEYCGACKTVVTDLTRKSNEEILALISSSGGSLCGAAFDDQFERRRSSGGLHKAAVVAGVAAMLGLAPATAEAKTATVKTEIAAYAAAGVFTTTAEEPAPADHGFPAIETPDKPEKQPKQIKRKSFLHIGSRTFYTMNVFPFIGTSKVRRGMYISR